MLPKSRSQAANQSHCSTGGAALELGLSSSQLSTRPAGLSGCLSGRPSAGVLQVRCSTARTMYAQGLPGLVVLLLVTSLPAGHPTPPAGPPALR